MPELTRHLGCSQTYGPLFGKGGYIRGYIGDYTTGLMKGDTRSLGCNSYGVFSKFWAPSGFRLYYGT